MPPPSSNSIATAADYADAMLTARTARTVFAFALIFLIFLQLVLFILVHFTSKLDQLVTPDSSAPSQMTAGATTQAAAPTPAPRTFPRLFLKYIVGLSGYFALIFSILLSLMLLLLLNVMLIGRLIGVSHVTSAFIFSLIILLLVFPWQAILNNQDLTNVDWKIPGILYNWDELAYHGHFENLGNGWFRNWTRFLVAPIITIILVFTVLLKSGHGLRLALGEDTGSSSKLKDDLGDVGADRNIIR